MSRRVLLIVMFVSGLSFSSVWAQESTAAGVQETISRQIAAFRGNDAGLAAAIAAPGIQQRFASPAEFMGMVKQRYPAIFFASRYFFQRLEKVEGVWYQHVLFVDAEQRPYLAVYEMRRDAHDHWRIAGVVMAEAEGLVL